MAEGHGRRFQRLLVGGLLSCLFFLGNASDGGGKRVGVEVEAGGEGVSKISLMFGSCNNIKYEQPFWPIIQSHAPDAWIWMGDNVYADRKRTLPELPRAWAHSWQSGMHMLDFPFEPAPADKIRALYDAQLAHPGYKAFLETGVKVFGTWDDHDYGLNDGGADFPYRAESQAALLDFLGEPSDSPRRRQEGVYAVHKIPFGEGREASIILLDNRYHKTPYATWPFRLQSKDPSSDFLGEEQWAWLSRVLSESESDVNIVVSGIQVLPELRWQGENWSRFPAARQRLLETILGSGARGGLILSGDVHFAEVSTAKCRPRGGAGEERELWEVTSSGMTHAWQTAHRSLFLLFWLTFKTSPFRYMREMPWTLLNVGKVDVSVGGGGNATASVTILSDDGEVRMEASIPLYPASSHRGPWDCEPFLGSPHPVRVFATHTAHALILLAPLALAAWAAAALLRRLARRSGGKGQKRGKEA